MRENVAVINVVVSLVDRTDIAVTTTHLPTFAETD